MVVLLTASVVVRFWQWMGIMKGSQVTTGGVLSSL